MSYVCMACWGTSKITGADPICERDEMGASNLKTPNLLLMPPVKKKKKRIPKFWMGLETKNGKLENIFGIFYLWYFNPSIVETQGKLVGKKISRGKLQVKNQGWNPGITFYSFYFIAFLPCPRCTKKSIKHPCFIRPWKVWQSCLTGSPLFVSAQTTLVGTAKQKSSMLTDRGNLK